MGICLSHITALEFWRIVERERTAGALRALAAGAAFFNSGAPTNDEIDAARSLMPAALPNPLHLLVPRPEARRRTKKAECHVASENIPKHAVVRIERDVFAVSPELCFLQMAAILSLAQLIALADELCGTYRSPLFAPTRYNAPPLTSKRALEAFLAECEGMPGVKKAHRALRYLSEHSASPMETMLIMMLCLPMSLGGYALPYPQQNIRIDFPKSLRDMCSKSYYVCDLYWPDARLAIEYDSDLGHTSSQSITIDASKRNELSYLDITVVTVTRMHVFSWAHMDRIAKLIAKRLKRRRRDYRDFHRKQVELRSDLISLQKRW